MKLILLFFVLLFVKYSFSDIPVHCLSHEIVGKWRFDIGEVVIKNQPIHEVRNVLNCSNVNFKDQKKYSVDLELSPSHKVYYHDPVTKKRSLKGTWTMIYDQGFEIKLKYLTLFAFSRYKTKKNNEKNIVISYCSETSLGWYHDVTGDKNYGCFSGRKHHKIAKKTLPVNDGEKNYFSKNPKFLDEKYKNDKGKHMIDFVDFINKEQKHWKAGIYSHPEIRKAQKGTFKLQKKRKQIPKNPNQYIEFSDFENIKSILGKNKHFEENNKKFERIPKFFDWRNVSGINYVPPVRSQGFCGSCYIFAAIASLESRIRILMEKNENLKENLQKYLNGSEFVNLSHQDVVSCSPYSQKCHGGFPYLVGKYGHDYYIVPDFCFPYSSKNGEVPTCDKKCKNPPFRVKVKKYDYIGGSMGKSNEKLMQMEILKNGPIPVNILVLPDFNLYKSGIYYHLPGVVQHNHWKKEWEPVSHSVLVVGWGEENGMKYWIVLNSWSDSWGESGYFRLRRGVDDISVESLTTSLIPEIIFN